MKHEFEAVALLNDYSTWGIPSLRVEKLPKKDALESGLVFGGTGGATLYKTEVFKKIGLFDEDFFAYSEDVDIDWRMQLAGYKVWYEKSAVVLQNIQRQAQKSRVLLSARFLRIYRRCFGKTCLVRWFFGCGRNSR